MVGGVNNGVLETTWVLKVQVQSAVLGAVSRLGARADVGLKLVETISDNL